MQYNHDTKTIIAESPDEVEHLFSVRVARSCEPVDGRSFEKSATTILFSDENLRSYWETLCTACTRWLYAGRNLSDLVDANTLRWDPSTKKIIHSTGAPWMPINELHGDDDEEYKYELLEYKVLTALFERYGTVEEIAANVTVTSHVNDDCTFYHEVTLSTGEHYDFYCCVNLFLYWTFWPNILSLQLHDDHVDVADDFISTLSK